MKTTLLIIIVFLLALHPGIRAEAHNLFGILMKEAQMAMLEFHILLLQMQNYALQKNCTAMS